MLAHEPALRRNIGYEKRFQNLNFKRLTAQTEKQISKQHYNAMGFQGRMGGGQRPRPHSPPPNRI